MGLGWTQPLRCCHVTIGTTDPSSPKRSGEGWGPEVVRWSWLLLETVGHPLELAEIHRMYIGDVERGKRSIVLINLTKIAAALGIPPEALMRKVEKGRNG